VEMGSFFHGTQYDLAFLFAVLVFQIGSAMGF
jgi:hypothetical protein